MTSISFCGESVVTQQSMIRKSAEERERELHCLRPSRSAAMMQCNCSNRVPGSSSLAVSLHRQRAAGCNLPVPAAPRGNVASRQQKDGCPDHVSNLQAFAEITDNWSVKLLQPLKLSRIWWRFFRHCYTSTLAWSDPVAAAFYRRWL